jgi:hypothetical protein
MPPLCKKVTTEDFLLSEYLTPVMKICDRHGVRYSVVDVFHGLFTVNQLWKVMKNE